MSTKRFTSQETTLAHTWVDQWLKLIALINRVTGTEEPPFSPPPPTALDEIEYMLLRSRLLEHEEEFLPLWRNFDNARGEPDDVDLTIDPGLGKHIDNPFLYFYEPENLYKLAVHLELQSSVLIWEPCEKDASLIRRVMISLGELMVDFVHWILWMYNYPT